LHSLNHQTPPEKVTKIHGRREINKKPPQKNPEKIKCPPKKEVNNDVVEMQTVAPTTPK
jgi:hypothetical protein